MEILIVILYDMIALLNKISNTINNADKKNNSKIVNLIFICEV